jgi:hypothetical protein
MPEFADIYANKFADIISATLALFKFCIAVHAGLASGGNPVLFAGQVITNCVLNILTIPV